METTGNKSAFVELICQLRDFGLSTAANAIRDLERDNVMVASNNHKLRTELAATQAALKEAREALRKARTRIVEHGGSGWKCSVTQIDLILSRPADTTALNRYVAEELRSVAEEGENMDGIFNDAYGAGMKEVAWYCRRRANKLEGK